MHVIFRIQPEHYVHAHHCAAGIQTHRHPTYRGTISKQQLRDILSEIRAHYGKAVKIQRKFLRIREADITLAYLQRRLLTSQDVIAFEEKVYNLLSKAFAEQLQLQSA